MTWSSSTKRLAWIVVVVVLACLNVAQLFGLGSGATRAGVRFVYLDKSGELREEKTVRIGETQFDVSVCADEVPGFSWSGPVGDLRPYVKLVARNRESGGGHTKFDPTAIEVVDSEGHRFRVVGVWPGEGFASLSRIAYRLELDAVEFNSHVKYQPYDSWQGMLDGEGWGPDERYTLRLRFPFTYRNQEGVIEIDRIVCFPVGYRWSKRYVTSLFRVSPGLPMDDRK